jgi:hypothetical protein
LERSVLADQIDTLLNRLKVAPVTRDLSRVEADVWRRIDTGKRGDVFGGHTLQVQMAVSCAALVVGLAIAQLAGYDPMPRRLNSELVVLSDDSTMAPSVRLEGGI